MSRLLTATGNYEDAYAYYVYLLQYQQSLELYNNAGVTAVLNALSYFRSGEPEVRFRYPLELDVELPGARGAQDYVELRHRLLEKALGYFDQALRLNPAPRAAVCTGPSTYSAARSAWPSSVRAQALLR